MYPRAFFGMENLLSWVLILGQVEQTKNVFLAENSIASAIISNYKAPFMPKAIDDAEDRRRP